MDKKPSIQALMWRCVLSDRFADRMKYGSEARERVDTLEEAVAQLTDKLLEASKTITDQNDLLECFYKALGTRSYDIVNTWKTLKEIKNKKNKKED